MGCSSKYCCVQKPIRAFDEMFVSQVRRGIEDTASNYMAVEKFVEDDFKTAGPRIGQALAEMYNGAPFEGSSQKLGYYFKFLGRQIVEGARDTKNDLKIIGQGLCVYPDEPDERP